MEETFTMSLRRLGKDYLGYLSEVRKEEYDFFVYNETWTPVSSAKIVTTAPNVLAEVNKLLESWGYEGK